MIVVPSVIQNTADVNCFASFTCADVYEQWDTCIALERCCTYSTLLFLETKCSVLIVWLTKNCLKGTQAFPRFFWFFLQAFQMWSRWVMCDNREFLIRSWLNFGGFKFGSSIWQLIKCVQTSSRYSDGFLMCIWLNLISLRYANFDPLHTGIL